MTRSSSTWHHVVSSKDYSFCSVTKLIVLSSGLLSLCSRLALENSEKSVYSNSFFFFQFRLFHGFCDAFFSSCWVMSARILTFSVFFFPKSFNKSMTNSQQESRYLLSQRYGAGLKWLSCEITFAIYPNLSFASTNRLYINMHIWALLCYATEGGEQLKNKK